MADEIVEKRGRGRPKGTGGNKRPDRTDALSVHMEPGENRKYITHSLRMWDWETPDMKEPAQVKERIGQYLEICAEDDMKPSVAGMALAFGVHRKTLWAWANGIDSDYLPPASRDLIKKAYQFLNAQMEDYAQNGKVNPVTAIFLMKNHFGYADKQEVVLTPNQQPRTWRRSISKMWLVRPATMTRRTERLSRLLRLWLTTMPNDFATFP
mgnify:CR=1 FL=1